MNLVDREREKERRGWTVPCPDEGSVIAIGETAIAWGRGSGGGAVLVSGVGASAPAAEVAVMALASLFVSPIASVRKRGARGRRWSSGHRSARDRISLYWGLGF